MSEGLRLQPAILQGVGAVLMLVVLAARLGLARPMRMLVLDDPSAVGGVGNALRLALTGLAPNLGTTAVHAVEVSGGGLLCFIPGVVAAVLLYPALCLVATGRDFGGSLALSVDWVSRHTGALLGPIGVLSAFALVVGCGNCCLSRQLDGGGLCGGFGPMTLVYLLPAAPD